MTFHRPGARVCARTGLVLAPSAGEIAYRVALTSYGPLNPPARGPVGSDVWSWSRYDAYQGRTVYTASTRGCAFDEVLAGFRRRLGTRDSLARDAAAVGLSVPEFLQAVDDDWAELGVMFPGHLPRAWRTARQLYTVTHPGSGWWVMLDTAESIAVIRSELGDRLAKGGATDTDLALLHGPNRLATVEIATWVRATSVEESATLAASPGPLVGIAGVLLRDEETGEVTPGASHPSWQPLGHPRKPPAMLGRLRRHHRRDTAPDGHCHLDQKTMTRSTLSYYAPTMSEPDLTIEPCDVCGGPVEIVTVGHHAMGDMTETTESREPEIKYQCTVDKSHRLAPRS